jgi:phosphopantetheinyl transferase (holo-ACP synthase)
MRQPSLLWACGDDVIVGLGVDITEVDRIAATITRRGTPFFKRALTPAEIA